MVLIGKRISHLRFNHHLSPIEMATRLNLSLRGYEALEHGDSLFTYPLLSQIASIFNVPVGDLTPRYW